MNLVSALIIVAAAIINAAGTSLMKLAVNYRSGANPHMVPFWLLTFGAMALYGGCFPLFMLGLSRSKLSVAQPMFSAMSFLAVTLVALFFFRETVVPLKIAGLVVIVFGIALVVS